MEDAEEDFHEDGLLGNRAPGEIATREQVNQQDNVNKDDALFSCKIENAKTLITVLQCLSHASRKAQYAQWEASPSGLVIIVTGKAKFTQAQGTLDKGLFQAYECVEAGGRFGINLTTVLDCLQIFGSASQASATMVFNPADAQLKITLQEGGVFTTCEIRTLEEDGDTMEFAAVAASFKSSKETCKCIIKSQSFKEAFQDLTDQPGSPASITFQIGKAAPQFRMDSSGSLGSCEVQFPSSSEAFVHFSCSVPFLSWTYALSALEGGMKALSAANETYIRINGEGIMLIQHQMPVGPGQEAFVDFLICANVADGDEEDGQDENAGGE